MLLFDVLPGKKLALPLQIYGVNALTVFVMSGLLGRLMAEIKIGSKPAVSLKTWLYENLFLSWLTDKNASLAYAVTWVLGWFLVLAFMYKKKWIVKI